VIAGESLVDCRELVRYTANPKTYDTDIVKDVYRFQDVLIHGVVTPNKCGKAIAQPVPGQLVLFVRPPHWWERSLWE
jgi:hypothetical protein